MALVENSSVRFLSSEWLAAFYDCSASLTEMPKVSLSIQFHVVDGSRVDAFFAQWQEGRLVTTALGQDDDADLHISMTREIASLYYKGHDVIERAVLQGEIEVLGNMQRLGDATAILLNESFAMALREVDTLTVYE